MRTRDGWQGGAALVVTALMAACAPSDDAVGFGTPHAAALDRPGLREHFAGTPVPLTGTLRALPNGCLVVAIDGVDHVVFWPDGTEAVDTADPAGRYSVTLPGGTVLEADATEGDTFTGTGVVADGDGMIAADPQRPDGDYARSYLAFCAVDAAPVAFADVSTVVIR